MFLGSKVWQVYLKLMRSDWFVKQPRNYPD